MLLKHLLKEFQVFTNLNTNHNTNNHMSPDMQITMVAVEGH